jgi:hypothetical protein
VAWCRFDPWRRAPPSSTAIAFIPRPLVQFSRIEYLSFSPGDHRYPVLTYWIFSHLNFFPATKQIILLSSVAFTEHLLYYDHLRVKILNHHLRVTGVLKTVNTGNGGEKWIWRAPQGQTLRYFPAPLLSASSYMRGFCKRDERV